MEGLTNLSYLNINAHKFVEIILYKTVHFPFYQFHRQDSEYLHQAFIMLSTILRIQCLLQTYSSVVEKTDWVSQN